MRYIAGQMIRLFTADEDGALGPFLDTVTNEPISPDNVVCSFQLIDPASGQGLVDVANVVMGTPLDYDAFNDAVTITQDETTHGYWLVLNSTLFLAHAISAPPKAYLTSQWSSNDPDDAAVSPPVTDSVYPSAFPILES